MRIACFAVSSVLAFAMIAPVRAQNVTEDYDRISGVRTIAYTADGSMDTSMPVVTFEASFVGETGSSAITLAFVSGNGSSSAPPARFAGCHDLEWRVDGRTLATGRATYRGRVFDGEMIELIVQEVDAPWATAIGNARDARYRVCHNEYAFTARDIEAFGRIAAKLRSATLTSSATRTAEPASAPAAEVEYKGMNWRPKHQGSLFPTRN